MGTRNRHGRNNLTPELQARICACLRLGMRFSEACRANGVAGRTGNEWLERGRGTSPRPQERRYVDFLAAVEQAESHAVKVLVERWMAATESDWRAARDLLARRFPEEWGPLTRVAGAEGGPLRIEVVEVDDWRDVQGDP